MVRLTISVSCSVLKAADRLARKEHRTKSEMFRAAFVQYHQRAAEWEALFEFGGEMANQQRVACEEQLVELIREMRREDARLSDHD
ncbi:MAG: ribbon-helix-helix protein, CopG family [Nitrospirae bacterium]|nr:ribbon-helix-helix protein, CopG family [Nitrospirota bacterium]